MDVLVIGRGVPDERYPMNGVFEFDQAKALAKYGLHVIYVAVDMRSVRRRRRLGLVSGSEDGVEWHSLNIPVGPLPGRHFDVVRSRALLWLYKRLFRERRPDIIHAHFYGPAYCAARLVDKVHVPLVVTEHSSTMNDPVVDDYILKEATYAYSTATATIAVGKSLADSIGRKTGIYPVVVPNIMGDDSFFRASRAPGDESFGFVFAGNLIERKRPFLLLDAFERVCESNPSVRLGIIGTGSLVDEVERRAKASKACERIRLYGRIPRNQMARAYCDYDCFVLPSANETFGVAYIEALAAGMPIICTACGGPSEFFAPELGLQIPVDDVDALVNAMQNMAESVGLYKSDRLKAFVQERFSGRSVAKRLRQIYTHCLSA